MRRLTFIIILGKSDIKRRLPKYVLKTITYEVYYFSNLLDTVKIKFLHYECRKYFEVEVSKLTILTSKMIMNDYVLKMENSSYFEKVEVRDFEI